jgi:hypothetical protein
VVAIRRVKHFTRSYQATREREEKPDPEGAFSLAVTARENQEGSIRARISELSSAATLWFEVELNVLLHSATAAGLQFGMTEESPGCRLRLTRSNIVLLHENGKELAEAGSLHATEETPLHIRMRLQQTGRLAAANDQGIGTAVAGLELLPEIRLFVESGQIFFTGISTYGLQLPNSAP